MTRTSLLAKTFMLWIGLSFLAMNVNVMAQQKNKITVSGKVNFVPPVSHQEKYPFVLKSNSGRDADVLDTIQVDSKGDYTVTIDIPTPKFYSMDVYGWDRITFWANTENLVINFRGEDTAKVKIKNPPYILIENSEENEVVNVANYVDHQTYQDVIYAGKLQYAAMQQKDSVWEKKAVDLMMRQYETSSVYMKKLVQIYKHDPAVLYAVQRLNWRRESELILSTLDYLIEQYPWLVQAQEAKQKVLDNIAQAKKIATGQTAPAFTFPNLKGKEVSLEDFKGNYLIIDFWASWCGPCRKENPHVKEMYEKYKRSGLEVLSVSIDTDEKAWRKAVKEDDLYWTQLIAKKHDTLLKNYQFSGIPFMVLLDKEGRIIAKNVRGKSLEEELNKLFPKQ